MPAFSTVLFDLDGTLIDSIELIMSMAGKAAGVSTAAVLWGPFPREPLEPHAPDYWREQPDQILRLE